MSTPTGTARRPQSDAAAPLRTVLRIDGWSTAVFGVVMLAAARPLSGPLGLPTAWSIPFGVAMLGGAAALGLIAGYPRIPARYVALVVAGNALSCVALVVLAFAGVIPLTGLGVAFLLVGALVVAVYAGLELRGLRRLVRHGAAA
ncbi:hypothetical protein [Nonomuraea candida]|uniref:hypothetical protein n=1 Tax=Nonomuraea candida TaxID=359159 RepID=UPI0005BAC27B|nr:hypothetical protein [Nonomuraea candida]